MALVGKTSVGGNGGQAYAAAAHQFDRPLDA
jgi:hypothetical protein